MVLVTLVGEDLPLDQGDALTVELMVIGPEIAKLVIGRINVTAVESVVT